jgi:hypothetical protein
MFRDNNVPHGLYGEHYARMTGAHTRRVTQPYTPFAKWESEAVTAIIMDELNKKLNLK